MARLLQEKLEEYRKCVPAWLDVTESDAWKYNFMGDIFICLSIDR